MATLYVVATPIGNLEDVSPRAVRVLGEVDRVLAEDTRRTGRLLAHLGLKKPLTSIHGHNEAARLARVLGWLEEGRTLALVSDAGTPLVSDPGRRLVGAVTEAGHEVVPIPGPSAVLAALVVSGLSADRFAFLGFVPRRGRPRAQALARIASSQETTVVFESPERLRSLLGDLQKACGEGRAACVARELTKLHETVVRGTLESLAAYYEQWGVKGEVTLVVASAPPVLEPGDESEGREVARTLLEAGHARSHVAREVARLAGLSRNRAYTLVQEVGEMIGKAGERE